MRVQVEEEVEERGESGFNVLFADGLVGVVGEAAGRADEEHRGGNGGSEDHGVVSGAGEDGLRVEARALGGLVELDGELAVHGHGLLLGVERGADGDAAESAGGLGLGEQVRDGGVAGLVLGMADVERGVGRCRERR